MFELPSMKQKQFVVNLDYTRQKFDNSKMSMLRVA
jgi:hypothetical protein